MEDHDPLEGCSGVKAPQEYENYRRRGPKKFGITYDQISELTGLSVDAASRPFPPFGWLEESLSIQAVEQP